ncbi:MAG: hypothetical protein WCP21_16530, partial [Armatimonadota bacterium]
SAPSARPVTIYFGRKAHVYDVRAGRYLGEVATYKTQLTPGVAQLYALLPYKLGTVSVTTNAQAKAGVAASYAVKLAVPAVSVAHIVRVDVFGPDGKERPWYAANLSATQGAAQGTVNFALDDQPGAWKIVATDVATGVTGAATVKIAGR